MTALLTVCVQVCVYVCVCVCVCVCVHAHINLPTEPEIADVVNEIAEVANWERLALMLGLSMNDIDMIRSRYDQSEHHQRLAEIWHDRGQDYTWSKLLGELDRLYPRRKSSISVASPQPENFGKLADNMKLLCF